MIGYDNNPHFVAVVLNYRSARHRIDALKSYMKGQPDQIEQFMSKTCLRLLRMIAV